MSQGKWTSETRSSVGDSEVVVLKAEGNLPHWTTEGVDGYVQAHDLHGRLLYDEQGRRILVHWTRQKTPQASTATVALVIIALLQVATVIAGIVAAVSLHDMGSTGF